MTRRKRDSTMVQVARIRKLARRARGFGRSRKVILKEGKIPRQLSCLSYETCLVIQASLKESSSTYHVIANRNEQIEEQESTGFHLHLHGAASLEDVSAPDDQGEVVCSKL